LPGSNPVPIRTDNMRQRQRAQRAIDAERAIKQLGAIRSDQSNTPRHVREHVWAGGLDRLAHSFFIAVHLRCVNVPIAELERLADRIGSLGRVDLENSEAQLRNRLATVEGDIRDCHIRVSSPEPV
jgi:hypothetical protein